MSQGKLSGLSVLIVEDIRATRLIIRTIMRNFGIDDVVEAADGAAALDILSKRKVDIVITDMYMAPMDGIEFTRRLRQPDNGLNPFVPLLMVSGHTEISRVKDAAEAGVTAFLAKPVTPANLLKKLTAITESSPDPVHTKTYCGPDRRRSSKGTRKRRRVADGVTISI
jgi:two-component system chemotaxis response regulator CheY